MNKFKTVKTRQRHLKCTLSNVNIAQVETKKCQSKASNQNTRKAKTVIVKAKKDVARETKKIKVTEDQKRLLDMSEAKATPAAAVAVASGNGTPTKADQKKKSDKGRGVFNSNVA